MRRSLNVGCGGDTRPASEGWVNLDRIALPGVDVVHDVMRFPWPFKDEEFDHALMRHVLEHVPHQVPEHPHADGFILLMEELHRILKPGGTIEIFYPHHQSEDWLADPTHTRIVHPRNFEYFSPVSAYNYYSRARFDVQTCEVSRRSLVARRRLLLGPSRIGLTEHIDIRAPALGRLLRWRPLEMHVVLRKAAPADAPGPG